MSEQTQLLKPEAQILGIDGIKSQEKVHDVVKPTKKVNPEVLTAYQKYQAKYMEVYGRLQIRKNWKKRCKLQFRLKMLEAKIKSIETDLYSEEENG